VSLIIGAAAMWYYASFNLATDYRHYVMARGFQGLGYGFFFVPASVLAYSQLQPDQNNKASSLTNLFRNWGGSFGIAFITTVTERREQFHQTVVGTTASSTSQELGARVSALSNYFVQKGFTGPDADVAAHGYLYKQLQHQVSLLAFMDCFELIGWITLASLPLLLLVRRFKPSGAVQAAH
jgi:DHA2 family multidrug resistance protein